MIKAIVIDDSDDCINLITGLLKIYCPEVTVLKTCSSLQLAVSAINKYNPDVVFLDIELNGEIGFDLFNFFPTPNFKIIFTTSHEKYAIKAIKTSCLDFILKPVDPKELVAALEKIKTEQKTKEQYQILLNTFNKPLSTIQERIVVPTIKEYLFIDSLDIICLHGEGRYTTIYTINGEKIVASKSIGEYEEILNTNLFFRSSRAWIVNLKCCKSLLKNEQQILLDKNLIAEISLRRKDDFLKAFSKA